jgi:G3E family GTPase
MKSAQVGPARYIMIGGFLGAGKSTSILQLARRLSGRGLRVGLITNDQAAGLVDTRLMKSHGFTVEEIPGGCFCCRFRSLMEAAERLSEATRPECFLAEPVGSCTDLVASVSYPLRRIYGNAFTVAPLSVLVDPVRALRILGLEEGRPFSDKVVYVYRKQLEEADAIVINKVDLLDGDRLNLLERALAENFPQSRLFKVSARSGEGLDEWFDWVERQEGRTAESMALDYDLYAEGEARLGWVNCSLELKSTPPTDGDALLQSLAERMQRRCNDLEIELAHLKMTLSPVGDPHGAVAALSLVRNDHVPELSQSLDEDVAEGELIINLRAEAEPAILLEALTGSVRGVIEAASGLELRVEHLENFSPPRPTPTYRMSGPDDLAALRLKRGSPDSSSEREAG